MASFSTPPSFSSSSSSSSSASTSSPSLSSTPSLLSSSSSSFSSSTISPSKVIAKIEHKKVWHDKKKDFTLAGQSLKWKKKGKDGEEDPIEKDAKKEKSELKDPMQRICFKFRDTGFCRYGDKCFYKHISRFTSSNSNPSKNFQTATPVKHQIKRPMTERKQQKKQILRSAQGRDKTLKVDSGKRICESWKRMGCCNFGYQCHYLHTGAYETSGGDTKKGFCRRYEETGFCEYGNRCWYSHRLRRHSMSTQNENPKIDGWESVVESEQGKDLEDNSHDENESASLKVSTVSTDMDEQLAQDGTGQTLELGEDHSPKLPELPLHFLPQRLREAAGLQPRTASISPFSFSHPGEPFSPTFGDEYPGIIDLVGQYLQPAPFSPANHVSQQSETPYAQSVFTQSSSINSGPVESFQSEEQAKFGTSAKGPVSHSPGTLNHKPSIPSGAPLPFSKFAPFSSAILTPSTESHWNCPRCVHVNPVWSRVCSECRAPRPHTVMRSTVDLDESVGGDDIASSFPPSSSTEKLISLSSESTKLEKSTLDDSGTDGRKKTKKGKKFVTKKKSFKREDSETELSEPPAAWPHSSPAKKISNGHPSLSKPLSLQDMWERSAIEQWTEPEIDDDLDSQTNSLQSPIHDTLDDNPKDDDTFNTEDLDTTFSTSVPSSSVSQISESTIIQPSNSKKTVSTGGLPLLSLTGVCDGCHLQFQLKSLKKCGWCFQTRYCSVACQRSHWKTHKNECHKVIGPKT